MKRAKGFTLIELIFVIVLLGIISAIASKIISQGLNSYLTNKNIIDANWQGAIALERITRELHMIRSPTDITTSTASQLSFTDIAGTAISYSLSGTNLMQSGTVLADGASSLTFTYFNKNGVSTATPSTMRYIKIALNITKNNVIYTLSTAAYLRDFL